MVKRNPTSSRRRRTDRSISARTRMRSALHAIDDTPHATGLFICPGPNGSGESTEQVLACWGRIDLSFGVRTIKHTFTRRDFAKMTAGAAAGRRLSRGDAPGGADLA